jgi:hypothetical protein
MVPIMIGYLPYVKIHDELVAQLLMLDADLHKR